MYSIILYAKVYREVVFDPSITKAIIFRKMPMKTIYPQPKMVVEFTILVPYCILKVYYESRVHIVHVIFPPKHTPVFCQYFHFGYDFKSHNSIHCPWIYNLDT